MKTILSILSILFLSTPAFANKIVWSCAHDGNANALTVSTIEPRTGSANLIGQINDQSILQALGIMHLEAYGIAPTPLNSSADLDLIFGGNVAGFEFIHVDGGIRINSGWTDSSGRHVDPSNNWFFNAGECIFH